MSKSKEMIDAEIFLSQFAALYAKTHPAEKMPLTFAEAAGCAREMMANTIDLAAEVARLKEMCANEVQRSAALSVKLMQAKGDKA